MQRSLREGGGGAHGASEMVAQHDVFIKYLVHEWPVSHFVRAVFNHRYTKYINIQLERKIRIRVKFSLCVLHGRQNGGP